MGSAEIRRPRYRAPQPVEGDTLRRAFAATPVLGALLWLALAATAVHVVLALGLRALFRPAVPRWQASLYWVDYRSGFVRRGLPGEILSLTTGRPPTAGEVTAMGLALTAVAIVALVVLALVTARRAVTPLGRPVVLTVVLASPFSVGLVALDPGRYDDIGFVALVVLALVGSHPATASRSWWVPIVTALATTVAVASEEFLVVFVVPVALLAMWRRAGGGRLTPHQLAGSLLIVVPAVIVAIVSMVGAPPKDMLRAAFLEARGAGVPITARPWTNGVVTLDESLGDAVRYVGTLSLSTRMLVPLGFAVVYLAGAIVCWRSLGRPMPRLFGGLTVAYGTAASLLGLVGVDYRRWWALAFVAGLASLVVVASTNQRPSSGSAGTGRPVPAGTLFVAALLVISLCGQLMPLYPTWDPALGHELPPAVRVIESLATSGSR